MHPQINELREAIERALSSEASEILDLREPDSDTCASVIVAEDTTNSKGGRVCVQISVPRRNGPLKRAEHMGFSMVGRVAAHPFTGEKVGFRGLQAEAKDASEGAQLLMEALQKVHGIGDAWLWITDLEYDDWPDPLPKPEVWPPAG